MKIEKLSLSGIKNTLSRTELKTIMAGSGGGGHCGPCGGTSGMQCCACPPVTGGTGGPYYTASVNTTCEAFCEGVDGNPYGVFVDCNYCAAGC